MKQAVKPASNRARESTNKGFPGQKPVADPAGCNFRNRVHSVYPIRRRLPIGMPGWPEVQPCTRVSRRMSNGVDCKRSSRVGGVRWALSGFAFRKNSNCDAEGGGFGLPPGAAARVMSHSYRG